MRPQARGSKAAFAALNRKVEAECPGGWPCNLCARDAAYRPLAHALAAELRIQKQLLAKAGRGPAGAERLEAALESGSFYQNTTWSCSSGATRRTPQYPNPVDESPFARTFAELLLLPFGNLTESERARLHEELVHRLGTIELLPADRSELDDWLTANSSRVDDFIQGPLRTYSTFRQRDFFRMLARAGCSPCFASRVQARLDAAPTPERSGEPAADPGLDAVRVGAARPRSAGEAGRRGASRRRRSTRRCSIACAAIPIRRCAKRWPPPRGAAAADRGSQPRVMPSGR